MSYFNYVIVITALVVMCKLLTSLNPLAYIATFTCLSYMLYTLSCRGCNVGVDFEVGVDLLAIGIIKVEILIIKQSWR